MGKYKGMVRWSHNGRSRNTESSNLSDEEFFHPSNCRKNIMIVALSSEF